MKCAWKEFLSILPLDLRQNVDKLGSDQLQELRLRLGKKAVLIRKNGNIELAKTIEKEHLQFVVNTASQYSPWACNTGKHGYITASGGHRIGLCGEVTVRDGEIQGISAVYSLNIRIARDISGVSRNLQLRKENLLVLGPPGSGKTTLLRDIIRRYSANYQIVVVDERGEIFPPNASFDTGMNTDVLLGANKEKGIDMALRTMSPQIIAVDEITAEGDCDALIRAGWCGVSLLATAHAASVEDLRHRRVYRPLIECGLFDTVVVLRPDKTWYTERMKS